MQAVLSHELCHVNARDNLTAAVHMVVSAVFWFHPAVWWIGRRLVEERELACDEGVLRQGNQREAYAQSILTVCKHYVESPLPCTAGVSGADLKKRIEGIMRNDLARKLTPARKFALTAAGLIALATPVLIGVLRGQSNVEEAKFEVASIRQGNPEINKVGMQFMPGGGLQANNVTLKFLIMMAYDVQPQQISGAPGWADSERYHITTKGPEGARPGSEAEQRQLTRKRLQALLAERFGLVVKRDTKEMPGYALVVAKGGLKMKETSLPQSRGIRQSARGEATAEGVGLELVARLVGSSLGRKVVDKTGLTARYDFVLRWSPQTGEAALGKDGSAAPADASAAGDSTAPTLPTALEEQLGLKLMAQKVDMDFILVERASKPTEN